MKKSLSLLVAIAMVFSMFAAVASAAPAEGQSAGEYLKEIGVIQGGDKGDLMEEEALKRQDAAILVARLVLGLEAAEDLVKNGEKTHTYTDVRGSYYDGVLSWAEAEGYMEGDVAGKTFGFDREVTIQEFATVIVRALGFTVGTTEDVDVQYADVVAKAVELGLLAEGTDGKAKAIRGDLYGVIVKGLDVVVAGTGQTLGQKLGLPGYEVKELAIASVTQTGVKQVTVKFNKPVDDAKAKFAVKNGVATRDVVKTTFSDDKTTAVIEVASKFLNGESTVTVTELTEQPLVGNFNAVEEKVTEIQFTSDKLALGTQTGTNNADYGKVSVGYKIINQFDEDVTKTAGGSLTFQVGKANVVANGNNGILTITKDTGGQDFYFGEQIYVTAILNLSTYGVTATKTFTVSNQAMVDSVDILSLYHPENKELTTTSNFSEFLILVDAKDQYGNAVNAQQFKDGVFAVASNGTLFTVNKDNAIDNAGPNHDKIGIPLTAPNTGVISFDGTNTVRIQTLFGQKTDSIDIVVKKAATLTTISLQQPDIVSINQTGVKIPFVALDQNGNTLTKYSDINGKINLYASNGTISLKQDYATKNAYIEWNAPGTKGLVFISATVVGTANNSQLQINVQEEGYADAVVGLKDVSRSIHANGTVEIEAKHIVVKDQFGRDMKTADLLAGGNYEIVVSAVNATNGVVTGFGTLDAGTTKLTLTGAKKGTESVKVELVRLSDNKVISTYTGFVFTVVDNSGIESYEVATIEKISTHDDHEVEVKVTGKRTDGSTVTLPSSAYTVTPAQPLTYDATTNKLSAVGKAADIGGEDKTKVVTYTVTILATSTPIVKEVTITSEGLKPTTFEQKDAANLKASDLVVKGAAADITLANVLQTVKVKDQFGFELTGDAVAGDQFYATVSALDDVNKVEGALLTVTNNGALVDTAAPAAPATVSNVAQGDSFTVTFTAKASGKVITVKVVAE